MTLRSSGILLHPASLPGRFGIGDLGPQAYRFVDFLRQSRQHLWQVLPLNPTRADSNHSPYYSPSTFAGDPLLISPEVLCREGFLTRAECSGFSDLPEDRIDYAAVRDLKDHLLARACHRLINGRHASTLAAFCRRHGAWLDTYALFTVLDRHFKTATWCDWPEALRDRDPRALREAESRFAAEIAHERALQFFFHYQWLALKTYCRKHDIRVFGDMPIYVPLHSADVWASPRCFKLGHDRRPTYVSGVPPDYFSETGQLWGHPVYDWEQIRAEGYRWWTERMARHLELYDLVRIDHFRGLVAFWQVAADADTALHGQWQPVPADELLAVTARRFGSLPVVAEDLGTIDAEVREVMRRWALPGMRVLQFAFGDDFPGGAFLPHNHARNCVAYTGTHDNNTIAGWLRTEAGEEEKKRFYDYLGCGADESAAVWNMIRMALQSVADTAILCFQDLLELDQRARVNHPAKTDGNWRWRLTPEQFERAPAERLAHLTKIYGRAYPR